MLIKALCDYYDILEKSGKALKKGYSSVAVKYKIALTEDGDIDEIIDCQRTERTLQKNGKIKEKQVPVDMIMPKRTEKRAIDSSIVEHRARYIFGLKCQKGELIAEGNTEESYQIFKKRNLEFIDGMNSRLINAYRNYLNKWAPIEQLDNKFLLSIKKFTETDGFAFCLSGEPEKMLQEEPEIIEKWDRLWANKDKTENIINRQNYEKVQCAITGKLVGKDEIADVHDDIKGIRGGKEPKKLICFKEQAYRSYGNEQSYNSNISQTAMLKYTEALNYLLKGPEHKITLDDITIVFWAMSSDDTAEDSLMAMLKGKSEKFDESQTQAMLKDLLDRSASLEVTESELKNKYGIIDEKVDFYMVGMKHSMSRVSIKFILRRQFGEILWNIAKFQGDMQLCKNIRIKTLEQIRKAMVSPNVSSDKVNPALLAKLFETVIYGSKYPSALLETTVRRFKNDTDVSKYKNKDEYEQINDVRAGIIKAYLIRNEKEGLKMSLDRENYGQAYLCGRLFAVLEKLQREALGNLNSTIKDKYFASAATKPAIIFPRLIILSQAHLKKVDEGAKIFYDKIIGEITDNLEGEFPATLPLAEQGKLIIGYYQQKRELWGKKEDK